MNGKETTAIDEPQFPPLDYFTLQEHSLQDPSLCFLCDGGSKIMFCEGECQRNFHWCNQEEDCLGVKGWNEKRANSQEKFTCLDCMNGSMICFGCEEVYGKTDGPLKEVMTCSVEECTRFYCGLCVSCDPETSDLESTFVCDRHFCEKCGEPEDDQYELVLCRRCPRAWHLECLGDSEDFVTAKRDVWPVVDQYWLEHGEEVVRRFIYCGRHKLNGSIPKTPVEYPGQLRT